ncbi:hypothetical protein QOZ80_3BG0295780 [Eleusine coracana subsp. coracana]|nr:hypothetical protein QOZ80_3BG0295780 [Eleusine coracana subsp. coracana]
MAAGSAHLTATLPCLPTLRPRPRRLLPNAVAASVAPQRSARVALHDCRIGNPLARSFHGLENTISLWTGHKKQALCASDRDSPDSSSDSSSSNGPPVLTILAGVVVFFLVIWVLGSLITWIVGLVFGAATS